MTSSPASTLRTANRSRVLRSIVQHRSISRTALSLKTNLAPPSVTRIVRELVELGLVSDGEAATVRDGPGRRRTELKIDPAGAYVLGFVLNASGKTVGLAGADGRIIAEERVPDQRRQSPDTLLEALAGAAIALSDKYLTDKNRLLGAAVACAGEVDLERQHLKESMALGWQDVAVGGKLCSILGIPVHVDNLNVAMLEATQMNDHDHLVADSMLVRVANGIIGGALMQGGSILRSPDARPSWLGHHPVRGGKLRCFCGEIGCLNTVASAPAMLSAAAKGRSPARFAATDFVKNESAVRRLVRMAGKGDKDARAILHSGGHALGRFLVPHVGSFGPSVVHIAGFVGRSDAYFDGVTQGFELVAPEAFKKTTRLAANDMSVVQAAVRVALDRFIYSPNLDVDQLSLASAVDTKNLSAA